MNAQPDNGDTEMTDAALLSVLAVAIRRFDPVPETARQAAMDALRWRSAGADVALLLGEDEPELASVRSPDDDQFEWSSREIRISGTWQPDGSLIGSVSPFPDGTTITLEIQSGSASLDVASGGRFALSAQRRAVVRILVTRESGSTSTEWFVVYP